MQADDAHPLSADEPTLALHYAASAQGISVAGERAGKPTLRLVVSQDPSAKASRTSATTSPSPRCAA